MGHGLDIRTEMTADHELMLLLTRRLTEYRGQDCAPEAALLGRATACLARHRAIAERYLYPELRVHAADGSELTARGRRGQDEMSRTLKRLASGDDPASDDELLRTLAAQLRRHARHEERVLLPALERHVRWPMLEDLGRKSRAARSGVQAARTTQADESPREIARLARSAARRAQVRGRAERLAAAGRRVTASR